MRMQTPIKGLMFASRRLRTENDEIMSGERAWCFRGGTLRKLEWMKEGPALRRAPPEGRPSREERFWMIRM